MRYGLGLAAVLAAFATGCGGHGGGNGTIVFQSDRSGRDALYAVRPDGSGLAKLLDLPQGGADVFWTHDGTKALVIYNGRRATFAYVFEPASRTRRTLRPPTLAQYSEIGWSGQLWSPDGKRLALAAEGGHIVILDVEKGLRRRITAPGAIGPVAWTPDGKRVLFTSVDAVYTAPASGGRVTRLVRLPADVTPASTLPQWSADGRWISLFDDPEVYVAHADGTHLRRIARDAQDAAWSPTGQRIAFAGRTRIVVVDPEHRRRRQLASASFGSSLAWSPDGKRIVYTRDDLGRGVPESLFHMQLWTMKYDGSDQRTVTRAFPDAGSNGPAVWVEGTLNGTPVPKLPLVSVRGARTIATKLPIVALAAEGNRAAVAQGFGGPPLSHGPLGPILVWDLIRRSTAQIPIRGCDIADDLVFAAGGVAYRCDNPSVSYGGDEWLRLGRPGRRSWSTIVHTSASEFSGSQLAGFAGDANAIALGVGVLRVVKGNVSIGTSRVWKATGSRTAIVRTFRGEANVASLDAGRIAVLRAGRAVSVFFPGGGMRTFAFGRGRILGAALAGPRLVVITRTRLAVLDLRTGRRTAAWPVRRGFGPPPVLEDAKGDLAAYAVGVAIHVLRLSDGREIVVQLPNATGPVFARFVPSGLFYSFNAAYDRRPGRLVFVTRSELERALDSRAAAP